MTDLPHHAPTDSTGDAAPALDPPANTSAHPAPGSRLHRPRQGRMLGGVAAGLADWLDVDPTLVRIAFVALACLGGLAVPIYLAGWALVPDEETGSSLAEELLARERTRGAW